MQLLRLLLLTTTTTLSDRPVRKRPPNLILPRKKASGEWDWPDFRIESFEKMGRGLVADHLIPKHTFIPILGVVLFSDPLPNKNALGSKHYVFDRNLHRHCLVDTSTTNAPSAESQVGLHGLSIVGLINAAPHITSLNCLIRDSGFFVTIKDIKKDEQLLTTYGPDYAPGADWYVEMTKEQIEKISKKIPSPPRSLDQVKKELSISEPIIRRPSLVMTWLKSDQLDDQTLEKLDSHLPILSKVEERIRTFAINDLEGAEPSLDEKQLQATKDYKKGEVVFQVQEDNKNVFLRGKNKIQTALHTLGLPEDADFPVNNASSLIPLTRNMNSVKWWRTWTDQESMANLETARNPHNTKSANLIAIRDIKKGERLWWSI